MSKLNATPSTPDHVGKTLRELRRSRRITIQQLANGLNRSTGYISQLERGLSQPTLKDLYAACTIFGVPMSWFVDLADKQPEAGREKDLIVRGVHRRFMLHRGARTELLTPELDSDVEFMLSTFEPGLETEPKNVPTTGAEYGYILKGQLELWVDEEKFDLFEGDSYRFDRSSTYRSRNPSKTEPTIIIWVGVYK
ncbi:cupin domain-containing protein [Phyllobacterium sp. SYP-B3895]|uniref:helix-turn-helix domain-containing protein n=1 Tax=Phyllobacterium sp. SYP-B3895 TaxID=2663240 RepID=UPI001299C893|nr:XRE family transcriptional regulator [Phyllobacterium sp. SYP-B3895]MRG54030.1 cupin domain-containing protein [Phyllobacterium sp. SYP-B3895]